MVCVIAHMVMVLRSTHFISKKRNLVPRLHVVVDALSLLLPLGSVFLLHPCCRRLVAS